MLSHQKQQLIQPQDDFWPWPPKRAATPSTRTRSGSVNSIASSRSSSAVGRSRSRSKSKSKSNISRIGATSNNDIPNMLQSGRTGLFDPDNLRTFSRGSVRTESRGSLSGTLLQHQFATQLLTGQGQLQSKNRVRARYSSKSASRLTPIQRSSIRSVNNHSNDTDNDFERLIEQIKQNIKTHGPTKEICEKAIDAVIDCGTCPTERTLLQLVRATYSQFINSQIVSMLQDRESTSQKVLQLKAFMGIEERRLKNENIINVNSKLKDQSEKIKQDIQESFTNTIKLEADFISDLLSREYWETASMFSEQCINQYFPLFGNDFKQIFEKKIIEARDGVKVETAERKRAQKIVKEVQQILYQGSPSVSNVHALLKRTLDIKQKHLSSNLITNRHRLLETLIKAQENKTNSKWQLILDNWRSSVANAKGLEAKNCHLLAELKVAKLGHIKYQHESKEWHACYDQLLDKLQLFEKKYVQEDEKKKEMKDAVMASAAPTSNQSKSIATNTTHSAIEASEESEESEETPEERKKREQKEYELKTQRFNIELQQYMGSGPDALSWSVFVYTCTELDLNKYIRAFYEHGVRTEFGLLRLQLQDYQILRLPIVVRKKIMHWQEQKNKKIQDKARGWSKKETITKKELGRRIENAVSLGDWLEHTYLLHLDKGSETTNTYYDPEENIRYTELYHNERDQLFYKEEKIQKTTEDTNKDENENKNEYEYEYQYEEVDKEVDKEVAEVEGGGDEEGGEKGEQTTLADLDEHVPAGPKYYFRRPPNFLKFKPATEEEIKKKQEQIAQWESELNKQKNDEKEKEKEKENEEQANNSTGDDEVEEEEEEEEEEEGSTISPPAVHAISHGFDLMKKYFVQHHHEFDIMTNEQMEILYMMMDVVTVPIGGTVTKKDEVVTFIGILLEGTLEYRVPPVDGDILGEDVSFTLPSDVIIGDETFFQFKASSSLGHENLTDATEKLVQLREGHCIVKESIIIPDLNYATIGIIPLDKLILQHELYSILLKGCGTRVLETYKQKLLPKKGNKKGKGKGKGKGKKGKGGNKKRPESPKKIRALSIDEDDYDDVDAEEVMYRVWIPRAREVVLKDLNSIQQIDPIEKKYKELEQLQQRQKEQQHWNDVIGARELHILRKFKAASVTLMKGVKNSFKPLKGVIQRTLEKNFSRNLLNKARTWSEIEKGKEEKQKKQAQEGKEANEGKD